MPTPLLPVQADGSLRPLTPRPRPPGAQVDQVSIPATSGEFGVLPGHVPTVAQLKPGVLAVHVETDKNVKKARRRAPRTQRHTPRLHTRPQTQRRLHGPPAGPQSLQP